MYAYATVSSVSCVVVSPTVCYWCSVQVPWTDLRYLFGEIMYGGHITDDWDRRLCRTYLEEYMKPELVRNTSNIHRAYFRIYFSMFSWMGSWCMLQASPSLPTQSTKVTTPTLTRISLRRAPTSMGYTQMLRSGS